MKIVVSNRNSNYNEINQLKLCLENDTEYYQVKNISSFQDETSIASILFSKDFFKTFLLQGMYSNCLIHLNSLRKIKIFSLSAAL